MLFILNFYTVWTAFSWLSCYNKTMQTLTLGLRYFFIDLIGGVLRWPFWWYTQGLLFILKGGRSWIMNYVKTLGLRVWIKNLFVPMYGMRDWQSRIISFFMRFAQIIFRAIGVLILIIGVIFVVAIYIIVPPLTIVTFFYQLIAFYGWPIRAIKQVICKFK